MENRGDDEELVALCRRLHPRLVGSLAIFCGDRGAADELAQETLVRVWNRWGYVSSLASPEGWAHHVALNLARSWWRRNAAERRAHGRLSTPVAQENPDGAELVVLRAAVAALPPRQRAVIALRYYGQLSVDETALAMGCAPGTVKSLTHKAKAALRAKLDLPEEVADVARS